jgi:HTH-type transcriptional regulator / antitoxin HigA
VIIWILLEWCAYGYARLIILTISFHCENIITRGSRKMMITISRGNYIDLLNQDLIIPKIIETHIEYEQFLAVAERLISKKQTRTPEETVLFRLLVKLIRDYEEETYSLKEWSQTAPYEFLQHLMEARGMEQVDLVGVLSPSKGLVSLIVNGKRAISKAQSKKLGEIFDISPSVFI